MNLFELNVSSNIDRFSTNKEAVENAAASMEMEGFQVSEQSKLWCEQLLNHEITFDEYLARALKQVGVSA